MRIDEFGGGYVYPDIEFGSDRIVVTIIRTPHPMYFEVKSNNWILMSVDSIRELMLYTMSTQNLYFDVTLKPESMQEIMLDVVTTRNLEFDVRN